MTESTATSAHQERKVPFDLDLPAENVVFFKDMSFLTNLVAFLVFLLSFVSPFLKQELRAIGLFSLSGAITNWLAIHMLFEKVPGLYGSGIIPLRFEEFKKGIRSLIMNEFFTPKNIEKVLHHENAQQGLTEHLKDITHKINYQELFNKLLESLLESPLGGMLTMIGGASALEPAKPFFISNLYL